MVDLGTKLTVQSRADGFQVRSLHIKVASRNSSAVPTNSHNHAKVAQGPQLPTPLHSCRGPGWRKFRTNSLWLPYAVTYGSYVRSTVGRYSTRYSKYTHIYMLTNIRHRFGHHWGLYESARQNIAAILNGFAFRVYSVFSNICQKYKYTQQYMSVVNTGHIWKRHVVSEKKKSACGRPVQP